MKLELQKTSILTFIHKSIIYVQMLNYKVVT